MWWSWNYEVIIEKVCGGRSYSGRWIGRLNRCNRDLLRLLALLFLATLFFTLEYGGALDKSVSSNQQKEKKVG